LTVSMSTKLRSALVIGGCAFCLSLPGTVLAATPAPPQPPSVSTSTSSNTTYSSVILSGYVDARGTATNYAFQYGTTSGYGGQTPLAPAGNGTISLRFSQTVSALQPATTYHYRIVALSSAGTVFGSDRTFTTARIPLTLRIAGNPNPVSFGSSFYVEGNLSGSGAANHEIVLQANPYPYLGGFKTIGNPEVSSATGGFSFPFVGLTQNAQVRVATVGGSTVYSGVVLEQVAVRVHFRVSRTHRHGYARLYGTVSPAEPGALVGFQLLKPGGHSVNEGGTVVKPGSSTVSRFSRVVRVRRPGLYRALVKVNNGAHASGYSAPIQIR
jgi:hypothetical protein